MTPRECMQSVLSDLAGEKTLHAVFVLDPILGADFREAFVNQQLAEDLKDSLERAGKIVAVEKMRREKC